MIMEISEEEYKKLQIYKSIVEDAVRSHIASVVIAESMKQEIKRRLDEI